MSRLEGSWSSTLWLLLTSNLVSLQQQNLTSSFRNGGSPFPHCRSGHRIKLASQSPPYPGNFPGAKSPCYVLRIIKPGAPGAPYWSPGRKRR